MIIHCICHFRLDLHHEADQTTSSFRWEYSLLHILGTYSMVRQTCHPMIIYFLCFLSTLLAHWVDDFWAQVLDRCWDCFLFVSSRARSGTKRQILGIFIESLNRIWLGDKPSLVKYLYIGVFWVEWIWDRKIFKAVNVILSRMNHAFKRNTLFDCVISCHLSWFGVALSRGPAKSAIFPGLPRISKKSNVPW